MVEARLSFEALRAFEAFVSALVSESFSPDNNVFASWKQYNE